ncbi:hypothetical protein ONZ51_g3891 [Trametes cubensis]|uniref:SAP domain-containing protein n=1 Tax=Trametes cubensis TaxID=1111947 RepID=A0AAD7TWU1_9APHY|nr:hypothetical protein ONZ51_g3891 [Trametes cubensis]
MLRSAVLAAQLRHASTSNTRSFVSTVLLTKAWENETVNELRKEARKRGLSAVGNKATLITRLQQDDKRRTLSVEPVSAAPQPQARHASTLDTPTEVPGIPSTAEPNYPKYNLEIKMPNVSEPEPESPTPIPFLPDFWESSKVKKEAAPPEPAHTPKPKVMTVAGDITHPGGGPSHNLYSPSDAVPASGPSHVFEAGSPADAQYDVAQKTETSGGQGKSYSRTLDQDERVGVWVLLGLFAGSWLAAGYFAPISEWVHKAEEKAEEVEDKAAAKKH